MNKLIAAIKKIRLGQFLTAFMVGILLFVSTACSSVQAKDAEPGAVKGERQEVPSGGYAVPGKAKNPRVEVPGGTATSPDSSVRNTFQGGPTMNEFSDVDPRAEGLQEAAAKKAEALKENAERNVIDQTSTVGENTRRILDKKGENAEEIGRNVKRSAESAVDKAQGTAEDFSIGTKRGTENIKDNTFDATKGVNRSASGATDAVKDSVKDLTKGLR
jgi:ElaB/YqjD/DUF883 family membrane-anchored ribosome-binding protein